MHKKRNRQLLINKLANRSYSSVSREALVDELAEIEKMVSENGITEELKSLYMRKYSKILEALKEKLENLKPADLNVKVS